MGLLFVGSAGVVSQWFERRRSLANGVATAGSGVGGLVYCLLVGWMIERVGVGWAWRVLGIVAGCVNGVCAALVRERRGGWGDGEGGDRGVGNRGVGNRGVGNRGLGRTRAVAVAGEYLQLLGRGEVWLFLAWGFWSLMGYVVLLFSLPAFAESVGPVAGEGEFGWRGAEFGPGGREARGWGLE